MLKNKNNSLLPISITLSDEMRDSISKKLYNLPMSYNQEREPASFDRNISIKNISVLNVLSDGTLGIRYSHTKLQGQDEKSQKALNKLHALLDKLHALLDSFPEILFVNLNPGDALILNNRRCLHGRSAITDSAGFDGLDRWLIRIYGFEEASFTQMNKVESSNHIILLER